MHNKVIWQEGMLLQPQHFQQQERYFEYILMQKIHSITMNSWGLSHYAINTELLSIGKFSLLNCKGIFPDGTVFNAPHIDDVPACLDIPELYRDQWIYLGVPLARQGSAEISLGMDANQCRYHAKNYTVNDINSAPEKNADLLLAQLSLHLLLETHDRNHFSVLPIARIQEIRSDKQILLDDKFIPPCTDIFSVTTLTQLLAEVSGIVQHRAEMLAYRLTDTKQSATGEVADFMLLQMLNRYEAKLFHLSNKKPLHPELLYTTLLQLYVELATYTNNSRRAKSLVTYKHNSLMETFTPIAQVVRQNLSLVLEQNAVHIALNQRDFGTWVGDLVDKELSSNVQLVLAVYADVAADSIRNNFPQQVKIAPYELIRNLVSRALPGITLQLLSVAPRQIPYHTNYCYFSLTQAQEMWQTLIQSAAIAIHIGGNFPGLKLELWAIKG